jgi:hypothetical protein
MRKNLTILAVLVCASAAQASESGGFLSGHQLRSAVSGKTVYIQTPIGAEVPVRYRPNGTMSGNSGMQLAMLGGESVAKDNGQWWISRTELCQKWNNWSGGQSYCYRFQIEGNRVRWVRNDGKTGTARLGE